MSDDREQHKKKKWIVHFPGLRRHRGSPFVSAVFVVDAKEWKGIGKFLRRQKESKPKALEIEWLSGTSQDDSRADFNLLVEYERCRVFRNELSNVAAFVREVRQEDFLDYLRDHISNSIFEESD